MNKIVIYGAGDTGRAAYYTLKNTNEILFFVDSDSQKWNCQIVDGISVMPPEALENIDNDVKIVVASKYRNEIIEKLGKYVSGGVEISVYSSNVEICLPDDIKDGLDDRTIDLGAFLYGQKETACKELTFMPGGSQVLDYCFLKSLVQKYNCKKYLEIGTYIGESINVLTDDCDVLYSVTAPMKSEIGGVDTWCRAKNLPNYSNRLTYNEKINHIYTNSQTFDYSHIEDEIDLFFIDADHSYKGVYNDTSNVFKTKTEKAIVVWHDFRKAGLKYNTDVVKAVADVLGDRFKNVYVTDRNLCGIYIPDSLKKDFKLHKLKYEVDAILYTYDVELKNIQKK